MPVLEYIDETPKYTKRPTDESIIQLGSPGAFSQSSQAAASTKSPVDPFGQSHQQKRREPIVSDNRHNHLNLLLNAAEAEPQVNLTSSFSTYRFHRERDQAYPMKSTLEKHFS